jgi:hypothetical protein
LSFGDGPRKENLVVSDPVPRLSSSSEAFEHKLTGAGICSSVSLTGTPGYYAIESDASSYFLRSSVLPQ